MPTKEEVMNFLQPIFDRERYSDYLLYVKESKGEMMVRAKKLQGYSAQKLIDGVGE